jgi:Sec-independent protein secretion pathway component TatC
MLAMFIPLLVLYELSIPVARLVQPKRQAGADAEDAGDDHDDDLSRAPA